MFCVKCGKQIPDNSEFCPYCGQQTKASSIAKGKSGFPKWIISVIAVLVIAIAVGTVFIIKNKNADNDEETVSKKEKKQQSVEVDNDDLTIETSDEDLQIETMSRPSIMGDVFEILNAKSTVNASIPDYQVSSDLSNVYNPEEVLFGDPALKDMLVKNGFAVVDSVNDEFFEVYENNCYNMVPNFVTVDSMMHTYHLYFAHLMKNTELNSLSGVLSELSKEMLSASMAQYDELKGTDWEEAAYRNVTFFAVGALLQDNSVEVPSYVKEDVNSEIEKINAANGVGVSVLTNAYEDYSQFTVRGYYEGNETLEKYFRAMMWYGRVNFKLSEESTNKSALLMTLAFDDSSLSKWEAIYTITSFFAGASDDNGYFEYKPIADAIYGKNCKLSDLTDEGKWDRFNAVTSKLNPPKINSIVVDEGEDNVVPGFRFMGQRFTIDAAVMQKLVFDEYHDEAVKENSAGVERMLPDVLDVPAALGSQTAYSILEAQGDTDYRNYESNLKKAMDEINNAPSTLWTASLYANWLNTLRPVIEPKGAGYPSFMRSEEWNKKNLETFAGSYAELKHDTVLYSKQTMAEMGGGGCYIKDDRGYVEPEPMVFARFSLLTSKTAEGLENYGMLSAEDKENLDKLTELANALENISIKELNNETLTDEEYNLIRCYGGSLEHFWLSSIKDPDAEGNTYASDNPSALVVDIATDPNGQILEIGTGSPSDIYVVVPVDGMLKIAKGSVYSFYQFTWSINDRLTDSKWREGMGFSYDENWNRNKSFDIEQPDWTQSYRVDIDNSMYDYSGYSSYMDSHYEYEW